MISDVPAFLRYFEGVHARTVRDVSALPEEAESWRPPPSKDAEASWGVPEIVRHIAEARRFFTSAFLGNGWVWDDWPDTLPRKASWVPALDASRDELVGTLADAGDEQLHARVDPIAKEGRSLSGWRLLMMMVEHEVHHRSQLQTYAGLNSWPVNQIFGRTNEWVVAQREAPSADA
ncbi:MAG: DinB family protein [Actinomycetota bacterium]